VISNRRNNQRPETTVQSSKRPDNQSEQKIEKKKKKSSLPTEFFHHLRSPAGQEKASGLNSYAYVISNTGGDCVRGCRFVFFSFEKDATINRPLG